MTVFNVMTCFDAMTNFFDEFFDVKMYIKEFFTTSKIHHDVKMFVMTSKIRHDINKIRHDFKNTSWHQTS